MSVGSRVVMIGVAFSTEQRWQLRDPSRCWAELGRENFVLYDLDREVNPSVVSVCSGACGRIRLYKM